MVEVVKYLLSIQEEPKEFKDFAKNLWKKNIMQSW
jgi:hypothetical protein